MLGRRNSSGRGPKVRPECEPESAPAPETSYFLCDCSIAVSRPTSVMLQHFQAHAPETVSASASSEQSAVQGDLCSLRIQSQPETRDVHSLPVECPISSLSPECTTLNFQHCHEDEIQCQIVKDLSHFKRVHRVERDGNGDGHRQISCHHETGDGGQQGQDTKQTSGMGDEVEEAQCHGLLRAFGEGSKGGMEQAESDATLLTIARTVSTVSTDSYFDCCRICQQLTEEALVELGCECRGELAKAHRSCIGVWFNTKGSNKCEICQHVASNVPAPASQPTQHFWVWRLNGTYGGSDVSRRRQAGRRFHPLWAALLILIGGLLFDVLISIFLGASALPVNIIIGVLVILGLGTAVRLVMECWHERNIRRAIQRMELDENFNQFQGRQPAQISV